MNILVITRQTPEKRGNSYFFPFILWKESFKKKGIYFKYIDSVEKAEKIKSDITILDSRLLGNKGFYSLSERDYIISKIHILKSSTSKIVFFDSLDGSGSKHFWLISFVDQYFKKQTLNDLNIYTKSIEKSYKVWLPSELTSKLIEQNVFDYYKPCPSEDLSKINLSWNIGLSDYRLFPFKNYLPGKITNSNLFLHFFSNFNRDISIESKKIFFSYRGGQHDDPIYDWQRAIVRDLLISKSQNDILTGKKVKKSTYIRELKDSKVIISPYGWGEICFRDFECFRYGSLLVKPNMNHLSTFPNFFKENTTYISTKWDLSDLNEIIENLRTDWHSFEKVAKYGSEYYFDQVMSFDNFYAHLSKSLFY